MVNALWIVNGVMEILGSAIAPFKPELLVEGEFTVPGRHYARRWALFCLSMGVSSVLLAFHSPSEGSRAAAWGWVIYHGTMTVQRAVEPSNRALGIPIHLGLGVYNNKIFPLLDLPPELLVTISTLWTTDRLGLPTHSVSRKAARILRDPSAIAKRAARRFGGWTGALAAELWRPDFPQAQDWGDARFNAEVSLERRERRDLPVIREIVKKLLSTSTATPSEAQPKWTNTLCIACVWDDDVRLARLALQEGFFARSPDQTAIQCREWLRRACQYGREGVVHLLLAKSVDFRVSVDDSWALLRRLCDAGTVFRLQMVPHLFSKDKGALATQVNTFLRVACEYGEVDMVAFLIDECGADIHADDDAALRAATAGRSQGHVTVAEMLVERGADVNAGSGLALVQVIRGGNMRLVQLFLDNNPDLRAYGGPALLAACCVDATITRLLLERGVSPNAMHPRSGNSALCHVVSRGAETKHRIIDNPFTPTRHKFWLSCAHPRDTEVLELLLEYGADIHWNHDRALRRAVWHHVCTEVVELLLAHGADPMAAGGDAIRLAKELGRSETVRVLQKAVKERQGDVKTRKLFGRIRKK
ncbi:ankyrin [Gonapodya prolifera JEL478]|uniref:Ankyrin n=1 Tax=Gonapodya prolifera (strain JEL478) TaxID=1344416 RepID=A0A139AXS0_GONPJ|nr:ankyrin [Gonapodya prolifera JEL478]|eukprot:KXS21542.1 ankyrin [Gonapodya prolifera JEL478]